MPDQTTLPGRTDWLVRSARMGLRFRPMDEVDLPFLSRLYASTRQDELAPLPWTDAEKAAFLDMQFQAQHRHYMAHYPEADWLIVVHDGLPAGRLYLEGWSQEVRVIDIALLPEHRSRGFGAAMMRDVMDQAAATRRAVSIHVEHDSPAQRFYRRLGFVKIAEKGIYHLLRWTSPPGPSEAADQVKTAS